MNKTKQKIGVIFLLTVFAATVLLAVKVINNNSFRRPLAGFVEKLVRSDSYEGDHYLAVMDNGELWGWGRNQYYQINGDKKDPIFEPMKVMDNVKYPAVGTKASYAICTDNTLWGWGKLDLIIDLPPEYNMEKGIAYTPIPIEKDVRIIKTNFHGDNTMFIKNDNTLWAWGNSLLAVAPDYSAKKNRGFIFEPIKVAENVKTAFFNQSVIYIINTKDQLLEYEMGDTGNRFAVIMDNVDNVNLHNSGVAIVLKKDGTLWGFGHNVSGIIGGFEKKNFDAPVLILEDVEKIYEGATKGMALKKDKTLWVWGLSLEFGFNETTKPTQVLEEVLDFHPYSSAYVLKTDNILYSLDGFSFETIIDIQQTMTPILDNVKIGEEIKGGGRSFFVTNNGEVYAVGRGGYDFMINKPAAHTVYLEPELLISPHPQT